VNVGDCPGHLVCSLGREGAGDGSDQWGRLGLIIASESIIDGEQMKLTELLVKELHFLSLRIPLRGPPRPYVLPSRDIP
jgi:hypothetical protein